MANQQTRSSLDVTTISATEWLISDPVEVERTGIGILGFIESRYGQFEVLAFAEPSRRAYFDTFDSAFEFVSAHHPRLAR